MLRPQHPLLRDWAEPHFVSPYYWESRDQSWNRPRISKRCTTTISLPYDPVGSVIAYIVNDIHSVLAGLPLLAYRRHPTSSYHCDWGGLPQSRQQWAECALGAASAGLVSPRNKSLNCGSWANTVGPHGPQSGIFQLWQHLHHLSFTNVPGFAVQKPEIYSFVPRVWRCPPRRLLVFPNFITSRFNSPRNSVSVLLTIHSFYFHTEGVNCKGN